MLVLSRKQDESIMLGDDISVRVLGCQNGRVKLGIVAPKELPIHRREIYEAIQRGEKQ